MIDNRSDPQAIQMVQIPGPRLKVGPRPRRLSGWYVVAWNWLMHNTYIIELRTMSCVVKHLIFVLLNLSWKLSATYDRLQIYRLFRKGTIYQETQTAHAQIIHVRIEFVWRNTFNVRMVIYTWIIHVREVNLKKFLSIKILLLRMLRILTYG